MSKHSIEVTSIKCNATSETNVSSGDEVYLVCQADGGLPIRVPAGLNESEKMKKGTTWTLNNLVLNFEYEVLVTIWDHDLNYDPNLATYLQSNDFQPGTGSGSKRLTNHNGADYTINYNYID
ncbi:hypothetical protein SNE25_15935 [Mucilaginibacter sabulilitoris]|uniref:Uncharacterized protein n=1 Tax=Mucilaginibacter sabulilitoris TaxID=1173583 RepID=A0ABZ0TWX4_9SPHI|nr:hypothetical protein [Mucilaginibacter sabulilitoris]WPU97012.1 hypothetical protein SNE25_15935 [Mucilaginibacter sabulilitoris]